MTGAKLLGIGLVAGFFGALFGVGGGIVIVPLLVAVVGFGSRLAAGTSLAAIVVTSIAGSVTYAFHGELRPGAAALVGLPAVVGVVAGSALQQRVSARRLSYGFALVLTAVAVRLVL